MDCKTEEEKNESHVMLYDFLRVLRHHDRGYLNIVIERDDKYYDKRIYDGTMPSVGDKHPLGAEEWLALLNDNDVKHLWVVEFSHHTYVDERIIVLNVIVTRDDDKEYWGDYSWEKENRR